MTLGRMRDAAHRPSLSTLTAALLASAAVFFAACDGDNLFDEDEGQVQGSPPTVAVTVTPSSARAGDTISIRVTATDSSGLRSIGYALVTATGDTLLGGSQLRQTAGVSRDTTFRVMLPTSVQPSTVSVFGVALDTNNTRGISAAVTLTVTTQSGVAAGVNILQPNNGDSYPLADSILVRVQLSDPDGFAELRLKGVAVVRDSLQNTQVVTRYLEKIIPFPQAPDPAPRDTIIQRFLVPAPGAVVGPVLIIATARDLTGNITADTVTVQEGPRASITNPVSGTGVAANSNLLVRINAADPTSGLDRVQLIVGGVRQETITLGNLQGVAGIDTTVLVSTGGTQGALTLQAIAWNNNGVRGPGGIVTVNVGAAATADTQRPSVARSVAAPERAELDDSIRVVVRATDGPGTGIRRMGVVVEAIPDDPAVGARSYVFTTADFTPAVSGTPERTFIFTLGERFSDQETTFPRTFGLRVHAFAVDASNNCGASVTGALASLECDPVTINNQATFIARGAIPATIPVTGVRGSSVLLPQGGKIADAVVDVPRQRIYLSNVQNNRVEAFNLSARTFEPVGSATSKGLVGAAPWGMVISNGGDSLYVANSGGTNISVLRLSSASDASDLVEDVPRRLLTPNTQLFNVRDILESTGRRYEVEPFDFSDRPQFIAQHSSGLLIYSTWPTLAAPDGTIRYVDVSNGLPEVRLLHRNLISSGSTTTTGLANIDSIFVLRGRDEDSVIIHDRIPGTSTLIQSDLLLLPDAISDIRTKGSDIQAVAGAWDIGRIGLNDTTFVAASGDRSTIAFGEGDTSPFGRIFLCCTMSNTSSGLELGLIQEINVIDLVNNAAERVFGLGLNSNGTMGIARGLNSVYYFSRDLRLQGEFRTGMQGGAGGAAIHPGHAEVLQLGDDALSFAATGNRSIKIVDALHFYERGEIFIRDNVVGPLRAVVPLAGENGSLQPTHPDFIVVKLVAVTAGDNVVVVNVRRRDITN